TLCQLDRIDDAIDWYQRAIELTPSSAAVWNALGAAQAGQDLFDEAEESFRRAIDLDPTFALAHMNHALALGNSGRIAEAIVSNRRALALRPERDAWHSNLLFDMPFDPACDAASILAEATEWNARHAKHVACRNAHDNDRSPERPLRVGYVSPNFYD